ncbi:MAG: purine-binding chemotaxis protein CheW [Magnetococcales bacterium]|nr:purine-binding chemotaxis protein CheW [Magnetococcales bacterium]
MYMPDHPIHYLVFRLEEQLFAIAITDVERVFRALWVTPVADAPPILSGLVNLRGQVVPVLNLRLRLELPERMIDPEDRLILLPGKMPCCFFVDRIEGVIPIDNGAIQPPGSLSPHLEPLLDGVVQHQQQTVLLLPKKRLLQPLLSVAQPVLADVAS